MPDAIAHERANETFTPPERVASAARRGLRLREKVDAGTAVGVARANQLAGQEPVSLDTIGRMVSYFARHGAQKPENPGTDAEPTPWLVAWLLWGGDAGRSWANGIWEKRANESLEDAKENIVYLVRENAKQDDALASLGLDPRWYVAAVPTELSAAGVVNRNKRIYRPEEFKEAHERLNARARNGYVAGLKGHPLQPHLQDGNREFDIAMRLMSVETYTDDEGVLRSRGIVAFPRTTVGQDMYVLWQGGLEIGTSSRARAMFVPHRIDESSPYWASNPEFRGETITEARHWTLGVDGTYDLVLAPSASTYLDSAAREAAVAFVENCTQLPDALEEDTMAEKNTAPESTEVARDEIVAQAVEAYRAADPFAKFDDERRQDLLAVAERVEGPIGARLDALEAAKSDLEAQVAAVTAERDALVAEKDEKARLEALHESLNAALADYPLATQIRAVVEKEIPALESVDALSARVGFLKEVFAGVTTLASGVSRTATESVDDNEVVDASTAKDTLVSLLAGRA